MRTTLVLDDDLLRQAKVRAAQRNLTVSDLVNQALRETLAQADVEAPAFRLVTYGRSGVPVDHEPSYFSTLLDEEDRSHVG